MFGNIDFELYDPVTNEVFESINVNNVIMDNVLSSLAGLDRNLGNYFVVIGTTFNDDELNTTLNTMPGAVFTSDSSNTSFSYNPGDKHFIVGCEINPLQGNGNIISIGIMSNGKLYNRAILKRQGKLPDNTTYNYKVVGTLGSQVSPDSDPVTITTGVSGDNNTNKITWASNGRSDSYQVYRKLSTGLTYHLLGTTNKLFLYDDGFLNETNKVIPIVAGSLPRIIANDGASLVIPVPYSVLKSQDFAARIKVKIQY